MKRDLSLDQTTELAQTFGLLADPTRLSIVISCMDQERSVGEIAETLGLSTSLTSHHLRLLRSAHILRSERRGKQVFYAMADACVESVLNTMIEHVFTHDHNLN
ncbi:ArsR/SmtB family transcription factor [Dinoroseobacter sp. S76]|uniref:ArsR/SmtB family transcription factor n=1 Tax=Dinoroseobacter sp. S76 TaxID=3415124 RepID=UPI003C7BDB79